MLGWDSILALSMDLGDRINFCGDGPQSASSCRAAIMPLSRGFYKGKGVAVRRRSPNVIAIVRSKPIQLGFTRGEDTNKIEQSMYLNPSANYRIDMKSTENNRFSGLLTGEQQEELEAPPLPRNVFMREHKPEEKKGPPSRWSATIPEADEAKGGSRWGATIPEAEEEVKGGSRWGATTADIGSDVHSDDEERQSNTFMSSRRHDRRDDRRGVISGATIMRRGPTLGQFFDKDMLPPGPTLQMAFRPSHTGRDRSPRRRESRFRRPAPEKKQEKKGPVFDLEKSLADENFPTLG